MASNFQSSFIPKEPATQQAFKPKKTGFLGFLAVLLFLVSIAGAGGVFFYKSLLKKDVQELESQLAAAEKNIDKETINEMSKFSRKLSTVKSIVFKHRVVSNFIEALASSTVSAVQFTDFSFGDIKDEGLTVNLLGKALNYSSIATQENILYQNEYFKSIDFSNLALGENGLVSFTVKLIVDPQISIYNP